MSTGRLLDVFWTSAGMELPRGVSGVSGGGLGVGQSGEKLPETDESGNVYWKAETSTGEATTSTESLPSWQVGWHEARWGGCLLGVCGARWCEEHVKKRVGG